MIGINGLNLNNLRGDIFGGLTTAVVALPLALAFGVASGAGPIAGIYGAIFVGFFAAVFGGTASQVSGPTGPMTIVMAAIITQYAHEPAMAFTIVIMGGAMQIVFGLSRLGHYITYIPFPVISGFMSGIGCIIIALQLGPFLGFANAGQGVWPALLALPGEITGAKPQALIAGGAALAIAIFMPQRLRSIAPPAVVAILVGTLVAVFWLPEIRVIGDIPQTLPSIIRPTFELAALPGMIEAAFILALLGSIDSLLTSLIADNITHNQHRPNRELIGQGIGNMVAGLFGAIPGAGATMRTVVNVRAGGRTPISGALHALVLLALVLGLAPLAERIPHAVLAGILLKVGWDIIDWDYLRRVRLAKRPGVIVMFTVLILTVFFDLIIAVAVGIILKSLISADEIAKYQARNMRHLTDSDDDETLAALSATERHLLRQGNGAILLMHFSGPFSFASAKEMVRTMSVMPAKHDIVVLDFTDVDMIDTSIAVAVRELIKASSGLAEHILVAGNAQGIVHELDNYGSLLLVPAQYRFRSREEALRHAADLLAEAETKDAAAEADESNED